MLQAIKELGEYSLKKKGLDTSNLISILAEKPNVEKVITLKFDAEGNLIFNRLKKPSIFLSDFVEENYFNYLYKSFGGNATYAGPAVILQKDWKKSWNKKFLAWFKKHHNKSPLIDRMFKACERNHDAIMTIIKSKFDDRTPMLLYCTIDGKDLVDIEDIKKVFLHESQKKFLSSLRAKQICSVCKNNTIVSTKGIPVSMSFFNLDKPGTISNGFQRQYAWKNTPICQECNLYLDEGWQYLQANFKFKFAGLQYLLLPKFLFSSSDELKENLYENIDDLKKNLKDNERISTKAIMSIADDEEFILEKLQNLKDSIIFSFIFSGKKGSQVYFNKVITDIIPSRFTKLSNAKKITDGLDILKNWYNTSDKRKPILFNFSIVKVLSIDIAIFLKNIENIFQNHSINKLSTISYILEKTRSLWVNPDKQKLVQSTVIKSYIYLQFLEKLHLISNLLYNESSMDKNIPLQIKSFFNEHKIFDTPAKRGIFLLGILIQKLLNIQYKYRDSSPFRSQLKGLRLNQREVQGLLPKTINKLREYEKSYKELEKSIGCYFVQTDREWKETLDEINYYLVLGMSLQGYIFKKLYPDSDKKMI